MNTMKPLYTVPVPSTDFATAPYWDDSGAPSAIRYCYSRDGRRIQASLAFTHVAAFRKRAERCCKSWHIEAYDTLVEVENSTWLEEIRADTDANWRDHWPMKHFMIYLDSVGCFEVIAESWTGREEDAPRESAPPKPQTFT